MLLLLTVTWQGAHALTREPTSCNPEYMDALEAKAWLHAQRRITQNQNLISKPDSVLEYSCFDQFIGYLAANEDGRRFSETVDYPLWDPISNINELSLDVALMETVYIPLVRYLRANFPHTFLGGRTEPMGGGPPPWGEYNCDAMSYIWRLARCRNFIQFPELDGFYDFPYYATFDPRVLPPEIPICEPLTDPIGAAMVSAYNGDQNYFIQFTENDPFDDAAPYEEDPIYDLNRFHLDMMLPFDCALSAVIPTGITVARDDGVNHEEHVCSMPACSYDGADCIF